MTVSAIYRGEVVHLRVRPRRHRLRYRVFALLLDLDEIDRLAARLAIFSRNRFNLFSFHDRDHGAGDGAALRPWIESHLAAAGIALGGGPIRLLCYPRILGYVFNPLSVYFCHRSDGTLAAIVYEVNNTFGERHSYLIPVAEPQATTIRQASPKRFYVSPFIETEGHYDFRIQAPGETVLVTVNHGDDDGLLLHAAFRGHRVALGDRALAAAFVAFPLMTLKIIAGIHWEALRLWRKGIALHRRPAPPAEPVTLVAPEPR
ncbi:MAG: DUF1365 domain-containing protein [Alphaproteobacteria bacterium]|nr:DUF1365 domain-containing protein [Alphaproteobacteria bacterium]